MDSTTSVLRQYHVSVNGFLPPQAPLDCLPPYYAPWDDLVNQLVLLCTNRTIKEAVATLPLLDIIYLTTRAHHERAYLILCLITHGWVWCWGRDPEHLVHSIPAQLAVPLSRVADILGIEPLLTHAAVDLYNWRLIDPSGPIAVDNLRCLHTMTGTMDEEWFFLIMTDLEYKAGGIYPEILNVNQIIESPTHHLTPEESVGVVESLNRIARIIGEMKQVIKRMGENCAPDFFYHKLRPFLTGWADPKLFPNGMVYEGVSDIPLKLVGGSAAQSSIFPVIDAFTGVLHTDAYFEHILDYMPRAHREFIHYVRGSCHLIDWLKGHRDPQITVAFNRLIESIKRFRQAHYGLVQSHIIRMMPQSTEEAKGTGNTSLQTFLTTAIEETKKTEIAID